MKAIFKLIKTTLLILVLAVIFHDFTAKWLLTGVLRWTLGVPVAIESAHLDWMQLNILFKDIYIKNPEGQEGYLAWIPKLFVDLDILALREKRVHFESIEVVVEELRVSRLSDGRLNLSALKSFQNGGGSSSGGQSPKWEPHFEVDSLILTLGRATYKDSAGPVPFEKSFDLKLHRMVYQNVKTIQDVFEIISWEALKQMGLGNLAGGFLDRIREDLETSGASKQTGLLGQLFG